MLHGLLQAAGTPGLRAVQADATSAGGCLIHRSLAAEPRLIDPPAQKTLQEEIQECWNLMVYANEKGQASICHKKLW